MISDQEFQEDLASRTYKPKLSHAQTVIILNALEKIKNNSNWDEIDNIQELLTYAEFERKIPEKTYTSHDGYLIKHNKQCFRRRERRHYHNFAGKHGSL